MSPDVPDIADRLEFRVNPEAETRGDVLDTLADLLVDIAEAAEKARKPENET